MSHSSSGLKVRAATDRAGGATLPLALPTTDAVTLLHGYGLRRALGRLLRRAAQFLSFVAALLGLPRLAPRPAFRGVLEPELGFVLVEHHDRRSNASREAPRGVLGSPLSLWRSGFFGKGSLSRGEPTWWLRHHITSEQAAQMSSQDLHQGAASERRAHARAVERAEIVAQVSEDPEVYRLMLEEAVFLACAVGCLRVHQETALSRDELWRRCREIRRQQSAATETRRPLDFALKYAAYHYYRSRGWVVKSGHLFGADFVLYRDGPTQRHSDFAVQIVKHGQDQKSDQVTWLEMQMSTRVSTQAKKRTLLCSVVVPDGTDLDTSDCLRHIQVYDLAIGRWRPERSRE